MHVVVRFGCVQNHVARVLKQKHVDVRVQLRVPAVRAVVGGDAVAKIRIEIGQHAARAADQRFKGAFRVGAGFVRPKQLIKRGGADRAAIVQQQVKQHLAALARGGQQMLGVFAVYEKLKLSQKRNLNHRRKSFQNALVTDIYRNVSLSIP